MRGYGKKLLSLALAFVMVLGMVPTAALAAESTSGICGDNLTWTLENGIMTISGSGDMAHFQQEMGIPWWNLVSQIRQVVISEGVTSIDWKAFGGCENLTDVTISSSVTDIVGNPFTDCTSLLAIQIAPGNQNYTAVDGVVYTKDKKAVVAYPSGRKGHYTVPDGVTKIEAEAFCGCTELTSVTLPGSVTYIGSLAFCNCGGLTSVVIPSNVTVIGRCAFSGCHSLTEIVIPNNVSPFEDSIFADCKNLRKVTFLSGITGINSYMFSDCVNLEQITIPKSITEIHEGAFRECPNIKDIYYSGSATDWGKIMIEEGNESLNGGTIHYNSAAPDQPTVPATVQAEPTNDTLTINGKPATPAAYKINGTNYFKLRDVAALITGTRCQFDVGWDGATRSATMTTGKPYAKLPTDLQGKPTAGCTAELSGDVVYVNGEKANLTVYKINGANYFKLRDLGTLLDFYVGYDNGTMLIDTSRSYDVNS